MKQYHSNHNFVRHHIVYTYTLYLAINKKWETKYIIFKLRKANFFFIVFTNHIKILQRKICTQKQTNNLFIIFFFCFPFFGVSFKNKRCLKYEIGVGMRVKMSLYQQVIEHESQ